MQVLVLNSGSSSIKYRLFDEDLTVRADGLIERIGEASGHARHRVVTAAGEVRRRENDDRLEDHEAGFTALLAALDAAEVGDIGAIGHRVVHGGATFRGATLIDPVVIAAIRSLVPLAPLHNPANLTGIEVATDLLPDLPQVAVFDTAFHSTLPEHVARYAIGDDVHRTHDVRRYGFHGTSHAYVAARAATWLERPLEELAMITLHLGNGASVTAVDGGRSVETSMGLSPLEGLVMGTRSGDIDPTIVFHLAREADMSIDEIDTLLNRRSGLKGLCGDNDLRSIEERAEAGDPAASLALDIYVHRIVKYVGAYAAVLGRLDAVVFTAGVGENSDGIRARVCGRLGLLGIRLDDRRNRGVRASDAPGGVAPLHAEDAEVAVLAVATDEEREIAQQTLEVAASV